MRENVTLKCLECGEESYITTKNKKNEPGRIERKKYCPKERKMTVHREKR